MSKRWISDGKQRKSKKYKDLHLELQLEQLADAIKAQISKQERKRVASAKFRATGS